MSDKRKVLCKDCTVKHRGTSLCRSCIYKDCPLPIYECACHKASVNNKVHVVQSYESGTGAIDIMGIYTDSEQAAEAEKYLEDHNHCSEYITVEYELDKFYNHEWNKE
jgi:hypothetical protein